MVRRILKALALSTAMLTTGATAVTMTPNAATASPVKAVKNVDTLPSGYADTYEVKLKGQEETTLIVEALQDDLEVTVFGPSGQPLGEPMVVKAGKQLNATITPNATGSWKIKVNNKSNVDVKYAIVIE